MKTNTYIFAMIVLATSPSMAQMAPGYGDSWNGHSGWWMNVPAQGYGIGGWPQGYGYGSGGGMGNGMMQGWRDPNAPGRGRFALIDENEDGFISHEEAASNADMVFTAIDADDDGSITLEEFVAIRMGPQISLNPDQQAAMRAHRATRFEPMDSDKDGSVSKSEFIAVSKSHFDAADRDGDGKVTPWEIRSTNWN